MQPTFSRLISRFSYNWTIDLWPWFSVKGCARVTRIPPTVQKKKNAAVSVSAIVCPGFSPALAHKDRWDWLWAQPPERGQGVIEEGRVGCTRSLLHGDGTPAPLTFLFPPTIWILCHFKDFNVTSEPNQMLRMSLLPRPPPTQTLPSPSINARLFQLCPKRT